VLEEKYAIALGAAAAIVLTPLLIRFWSKFFPSRSERQSLDQVHPSTKRINNEAAVAAFFGLVVVLYPLEQLSPLTKADVFFGILAIPAFYGAWIYFRGAMSQSFSANQIFESLGKLGGVSKRGVQMPIAFGTVLFLVLAIINAERLSEGARIAFEKIFGG